MFRVSATLLFFALCATLTCINGQTCASNAGTTYVVALNSSVGVIVGGGAISSTGQYSGPVGNYQASSTVYHVTGTQATFQDTLLEGFIFAYWDSAAQFFGNFGRIVIENNEGVWDYTIFPAGGAAAIVGTANDENLSVTPIATTVIG